MTAASQWNAGIVDLTNPAAVAWYRQIIVDNMIGAGSAGWMVRVVHSMPPFYVLIRFVGGLCRVLAV
jgi:hypothetical protein